MPNVKFKLREPNSTDVTVIQLQFIYNNDTRLIYQTGLKVRPNQWNTSKQRVKELRTFPSYPEYNQYLTDLESKVLSIYQRYRNENKPLTNEIIRAEINQEYTVPEVEEKVTFFKYIDTFIESKKGTVSHGTIVQYIRLKNMLLSFQKKEKFEVDFDTINLDFHDIFSKYLDKQNFAENYKGNFIKHIKAVLRHATERGINKNLMFQSRDFKRTTFDTDDIYLTDSEIELIHNFDFSYSPRLEEARDLFLFCCYTGMAHKDASNVKPEHIQTKYTPDKKPYKVVCKARNKTGVAAEIPIGAKLQQVLDRYNGKAPPTKSKDKLNEYLFELCQIIGFNDTVCITEMRGGKKEEVVYKKNELIRSHTGRRSFCTNAYKAGIPTIAIIKMSGHKTESEFLKYIKVGNEENAANLTQHKFFQ